MGVFLMKLKELQGYIQSAAAFRCVAELQPAGGPGDKVFPPTYADAAYAQELRIVPGYEKPVRCVLLDSVQSQANRAEEALQDAIDDGRIKIPVVEVDFTDIPVVEPGSTEEGLYEPIGRVTSLEAPHRIADAILRDSELDGQPFRSSAEGKKIVMATLRNATPIFELCPTALIYGIWDSTGPKGGLGVKFQRAVVSEIIGIDAALGNKTSSRMDPLSITLKAGPVYEGKDGTWTTEATEAKLDNKKKPTLVGKEGKPSEVNHGNIVPSLSETSRDPLNEFERIYLAGGVTIRKAEQTTVISLPALRRLRFPLGNNSKPNQEANLAAQSVLAALALCGAVLAAEKGLDLRSRCLLALTKKPSWEVVAGDGAEPKKFELDARTAIALLNEAIQAAKSAGLPWRDEPLVLKPAKKLVDLVRKSQDLAVKSGAEEGADA